MDAATRCQWTWLHRGIGLAMRIASPRSAYRAWIVIDPLDANRAATRAVLRDFKQPMPLPDTPVYRVRHLAAERLALGLMLQLDGGGVGVACIDEFFAYGDTHLVSRLEQCGLSIATFFPTTTAAAYDERSVRAVQPA